MKKMFLMLSAALLLLCTMQEKVSAQSALLSPVAPPPAASDTTGATPATRATPNGSGTSATRATPAIQAVPAVSNRGEERTLPETDRDEKEKVRREAEMRNQGVSMGNPILPSTVVKVDGRTVFVIMVPIPPSRFVWIDPPAAVGYDYSVEKGPKVTGVELPTGVGDNVYDLWTYNEQVDTYTDSGVDIEGGALYQFNEPVTKFSIRGIENSAGLDPNNETAFPTGLRFEKTGRAIVNMTSIENEM